MLNKIEKLKEINGVINNILKNIEIQIFINNIDEVRDKREDELQSKQLEELNHQTKLFI